MLAMDSDTQTQKCTLHSSKIPAVNISDQMTWIALMQRNGCKFDEMVIQFTLDLRDFLLLVDLKA